MDTEDGRIFIKHLAYYIRTHEKALANSILASNARDRQIPRNGQTQIESPSSPILRRPSTAPVPSTTSSALTSALTFGFVSSNVRPAKLYLTPNQLYYLLSRFEELGVAVGPMNVRLENISSDSTPSEYVSFLTQTKRPKGRSTETDSLHSVSSVRSVVSSMSTMWSNLGMSSNSVQREEKRKAAELEDMRYLYSAFTKIPCLKLVLDHRVRRIKGYEEFPFDTAVPVWAFKNLSTLEVVDLDFRSFFGWDRLAEQLRHLTVKRAGLDDLTDLLTNIVLDDMDKRRRRSAKASSPVMAFASPSPAIRQAELARIYSANDSIPADLPRQLSDKDKSSSEASHGGPVVNARPRTRARMNSASPSRPQTSHGRSTYLSATSDQRQRRSSSNSSSSPKQTPRTSSANLLSFHGLPASKWRFLRYLSVADNALTSIEPHSLSPVVQTLQSFDLSSNLFTEIPDSLSILVSLRALNLSNCMIESLHSLVRNPLPAITVLNLRHNRLQSLAGIEKLPSLERLDLQDNKLRDPSELARLTGMPNFKEVFVSKNPFTKSHPNHRIAIFNLFRQSYGYTEDILIDTTGPGYNERKYLTDRVMEPPSIPVVRRPFDEDTDRKPPPEQAVPESIPESTMGQEAPQTPTQTPNRSGRKTARRRIVDMSQQESPKTPASVSTYAASPEAVSAPINTIDRPSTPTPRRRKDEDWQEPFHPSQSTPSEASVPSTPNVPTHPLTRPPMRPDLSMSSEQYRKRIETLKHEHGSNWLSALHNDADPFYRNASPGAVS